MIDSSALLLAIIMTTPAESLEMHSQQDYASVNTLDAVMQRLCWPHSATLSMQCDDEAGPAANYQDTQDQNLMKALNSIRYIKYQK